VFLVEAISKSAAFNVYRLRQLLQNSFIGYNCKEPGRHSISLNDALRQLLLALPKSLFNQCDISRSEWMRRALKRAFHGIAG
jgi:hypothetical protein